jgi:anti-sigma28 factor (negative regulator of flagellin synthesis)
MIRIEGYGVIKNNYNNKINNNKSFSEILDKEIKEQNVESLKKDTSISYDDVIAMSTKYSKLSTYDIAKSAVDGAMDIRIDKVNDIKQRLVDGTYNVDIDDFVDKLLKKMK